MAIRLRWVGGWAAGAARAGRGLNDRDALPRALCAATEMLVLVVTCGTCPASEHIWRETRGCCASIATARLCSPDFCERRSRKFK